MEDRGCISWRDAEGVEEERDTVFVSLGGCEGVEDAAWSDFNFDGGGKPDMTGGGRSRPSAAFLDNCRAKSEACHHSRNFRANMEVGRSSLRLERTRGYTIFVKLAGLYILDPWPGRAPGVDGGGCGGCSARAMAP